MAFLRKRNRVYHIEWKERTGTDAATGKGIYAIRSKSTKMERLSDAKTELAKFERDGRQKQLDGISGATSPMNPTCAQFWKSFAAKFKDGYRPSSWEAKSWAWARLPANIGADSMSDITRDKVVALRASWTQSPSTFNDMIRACAGIWRLGRKHRLHTLDECPFDDVKGLPVIPVNKDVLSVSQIETLCWQAADHASDSRVSNIHAMFVLIGYFGLRSIEAENARWEWLDWKRGLFNVTQGNGFTTKSKKNRTIPLFDAARLWLDPMRLKSGYIFRLDYEVQKPGYGRTVEYRRSWDCVCAKAGMKGVYPHLLRHSWITNLLHAGAAPYDVADWAGHSGPWIQERYRHAMPVKEGATKLL